MSEAQNLSVLITQAQQQKLGRPQPTSLWQPEAGEMRVRVEAAAGNPIDWIQIDMNIALPSFPFTQGIDLAGVVDMLGPEVENLAVGDRVACMAPLGHAAKYGAYQQHCIVRADATVLPLQVPESYSFDEAATTPLAFWTAALGLFSLLNIPSPLDASGGTANKTEGEAFLVWGGSSSVGAMAVQLAKLSGFRVITTASPRNFEYVKSLGAEVLDYQDPEVVEQIKTLAPNLRYAYDSISTPQTTPLVLSCLTHPEAEAVVVHPFSSPPAGVKVHHVWAGTPYMPGNEAELSSLRNLWQTLMKQGKIKPHPVRVMPGGLGAVDEGLALMRKGKVSGEKLIFRPGETKV